MWSSTNPPSTPAAPRKSASPCWSANRACAMPPPSPTRWEPSPLGDERRRRSTYPHRPPQRMPSRRHRPEGRAPTPRPSPPATSSSATPPSASTPATVNTVSPPSKRSRPGLHRHRSHPDRPLQTAGPDPARTRQRDRRPPAQTRRCGHLRIHRLPRLHRRNPRPPAGARIGPDLCQRRPLAPHPQPLSPRGRGNTPLSPRGGTIPLSPPGRGPERG